MRQNLNKCLLPSPTLDPSLFGVLRFRQHPIAICGDIKFMFDQVLNEDKSLCFLGRGMQLDQEPSVYKWQVWPFGTTVVHAVPSVRG